MHDPLPDILRFRPIQSGVPGEDCFGAIGIPEVTALLRQAQIHGVGKQMEMRLFLLVSSDTDVQGIPVLCKIKVLRDRRLLIATDHGAHMTIMRAESFIDMLLIMMGKATERHHLICFLPASVDLLRALISMRVPCEDVHQGFVDTYQERFTLALRSLPPEYDVILQGIRDAESRTSPVDIDTL